ncbi:hypothetical protein L195_g049019, partial [Trifolium pratense]
MARNNRHTTQRWKPSLSPIEEDPVHMIEEHSNNIDRKSHSVKNVSHQSPTKKSSSFGCLSHQSR